MGRHKIKLTLLLTVCIVLGMYVLRQGWDTNPIWIPSPGVEFVPPPPSKDPGIQQTVFSASELKSRSDVQTGQQKANDLLLKIKQTCDQFGLQFGGPSTFNPTEGRIEISWGNSRLKLESPDYWFFFTSPDLQNQSFLNKTYETAIDGVNSPFTDKPDQAKWGADQAIKVASAFLTILVRADSVQWGPPHAKYEHLHMNLPKYYEGTWTVSWSRIDEKGRTYASQGARLDISETWGLTNAVVWLDKAYIEKEGAIMPASKAIAIAKSKHPAMGTPSDNIIGYSVKSSELMIVQPYNVGGYQSRLAWVIWLQPTRSPGSQSFMGYDDGQEVTVDAMTGQILGTNAWL